MDFLNLISLIMQSLIKLVDKYVGKLFHFIILNIIDSLKKFFKTINEIYLLKGRKNVIIISEVI